MAISKVYLINVPMEKDYSHTMFFESEQAQQSYFREKAIPKLSFTDFSYRRKDAVIQFPVHIDTLYASKVNYCMYQNTEYSNKWFYAFVTDMKYIDDGRTDVYIKTDCIQTWMFDVTVKPSFVEREHVKTDEIGEHTIDEGLETGEYIVNDRSSAYFGDKLCIVMAVSKDTDGKTTPGYLYNGIFSGLRYYVFSAETTSQIQEFIMGYDYAGVGEDIVSMFLVPQELVSIDGTIAWRQPLPETSAPIVKKINHFTGEDGNTDMRLIFSREYIDNRYTPRNKKLFCYPYRYLLATNHAGASAIYKFENFYDEGAINDAGIRERTLREPCFTIEGVVCPGCSIRMYPQYYNGAIRNYDEGLTMGKFPILNWTSDAYTNWLTQNSVNTGVNLITGIGQIAAGVAMTVGTAGIGAAVGVGSIAGGVSTITGTMAQVHQQSFAPDQVKGNINAGDVITAMGQNSFMFYVMSVKSEMAAALDDYFDMFGYKCHRVKIPEKNHRENYWYTKTIDANIVGGIPQDDLQTIKDCYNRGITFWKNEENFRDYSAPNAIV